MWQVLRSLVFQECRDRLSAPKAGCDAMGKGGLWGCHLGSHGHDTLILHLDVADVPRL